MIPAPACAGGNRKGRRARSAALVGPRAASIGTSERARGNDGAINRDDAPACCRARGRPNRTLFQRRKRTRMPLRCGNVAHGTMSIGSWSVFLVDPATI